MGRCLAGVPASGLTVARPASNGSRTDPATSGATDLVASSTGGDAVVDAVMLEPLVSRYVIGGDGHTTAMLRSAARAPQTVSVTVAGSGTAVIDTYDAAGVRRSRASASGATVRAVVLPGGFTLVRR